MRQPSDEIKSKLDIVDVIREYIPLKPAGVNFRALCPFHREKTPSFVVSPEKQIWHCFGCSKGGDIFSFVMEMDGLSFVDALRVLAPKAGVALKKQDPKLTSRRNRLLDIVEFSKNYYRDILARSDKARAAREYLKQRGLTKEAVEEWQIGYSPDSWDDLINLLKNKGFNDKEIFQAGMSVNKEGTSRFYNRFRGRIMFPINDVNGNTVAFSARVGPEKEQDEKMGKYINSPQTMLYDKSKILFGLDKAKREIKNNDLAIIVEGQMDVITAHSHGYKNVVASSGTALTAEQIALLKRYSNNIALAFDADKAGEMAAERGTKEAFRAEMSVKIIEIPAGKDPDECIKNDKRQWESALENARPFMEYYFEKIFTETDLEQADGKRAAAKKILPLLADIKNAIEKDLWLKKLSQGLDVDEQILREAALRAAQKAVSAPADAGASGGQASSGATREEMLSELFIALLLKFPLLAEYAINAARPEQIAGRLNRLLYRNIAIYYNNLVDDRTQQGGQTEPPRIGYGGLKQWLESSETQEDKDGQLALLDKLALLGDRDFFDFSIEQAKSEIIKVVSELKKYHLSAQRKEIGKLIAQAEKEGDEERAKELMEEFKRLTDEMAELGN